MHSSGSVSIVRAYLYRISIRKKKITDNIFIVDTFAQKRTSHLHYWQFKPRKLFIFYELTSVPDPFT